ncbi:MAG: hypothetical protein ABI559_12130 [Chloroflexota bacterium]
MQRRTKPQQTRSASGGYATLVSWIVRLAKLDFSVFDDVRNEQTATASAILIVLGAGIIGGLGSWGWALQYSKYDGLDPAPVFLKTVIAGSVIQLVIWFAWVYIAYLVAARGFGATVGFQQLVRTMGVAFAPVALSIGVAIAPLAVPFGVFSLAITFLFTNIAIEQASDLNTRESMLANLAGFAIFLIFMGAAANIAKAGAFGGLAPGILFFSLHF